MADISERLAPAEAAGWWRRAHETLGAMRDRGLHISPQDMGFLEQLRRKVEGG